MTGSLEIDHKAGVSRTVILVSAFAAIGGFLYGYDMGLISGALLSIARAFDASSTAQACIVGAAKAGACAGVLVGGVFMYKYGRCRTIGASSLFFMAGPALMASAASVAQLVLGRLVIGVGIGMSAVVTPAYLAELAPTHLRGALVSAYEALLCVGMLVSILTDAALENTPGNWRWMTGSPIVPALLYGLAPCVLPESPRWLIVQGNFDAALAVLLRVNATKERGQAAGTAAAEQELLMLWSAVEQDRGHRSVRATGTHVTTLPHAARGMPGSPRSAQALPGHADNVFHGHAEPGHVRSDSVLQAAVHLSAEPSAGSSAAWSRHARQADGGFMRVANGGRCDSERSTDSPGGAAWRSSTHAGELSQQPPAAEALQLDAAQYQSQRPLLGVAALVLGDIVRLFRGPERRAALIAVLLAVSNQVGASTSIINYAPQVLQKGGVVQEERAILMASLVGAAKLAGSLAGMLLVDRSGRRALLLWGGSVCACAMFALCAALYAQASALVAACMCLYILAFSASWAGVFWVVVSEIFSMLAKSAAMSVAIAALFLSGAATDVAFPFALSQLGSGAFAMYGAVTLVGVLFVFIALPETRNLSLTEAQAALRGSAD